jgi:hypothetical protein
MLDKLHEYSFPPRGAIIERDRLAFYLQRASGTLSISEVQANWDILNNNDVLYHAYNKAWGSLLYGCRPLTDEWLFMRTPVIDAFGEVRGQFEIRQESFDILWAQVEDSKSPGLPFVATGLNTNGDLAPEDVKKMLEERLYNLWRLKMSGDEDFVMACSYVFNACFDPAKIHVKDEITKRNKIARLIFAGSVVDRLVLQILFFNVLRTLPQRYLDFSHCSAIGIDLTKGERFFEKSQEHFEELRTHFPSSWEMRLGSVDTQGAEYVNNEHMKDMFFHTYDMRVNHRGMLGDIFDTVRKLYCSKACVALSDGKIFQTALSFILSGFLITHLANTVGFAAIADLVNLPRPFLSEVETKRDADYQVWIQEPTTQKANGDDDLGLVSRYASANTQRLGLVVVHGEANAESFSYCSHTFTRHGAYPESLRKSLSNLTFALDDEEVYGSYELLFAGNPKEPSIRNFMRVLKTVRHRLRELAMVDETLGLSVEDLTLEAGALHDW